MTDLAVQLIIDELRTRLFEAEQRIDDLKEENLGLKYGLEEWKKQTIGLQNLLAERDERLMLLEEAAKATVTMATAGGYPNIDELQAVLEIKNESYS